MEVIAMGLVVRRTQHAIENAARSTMNFAQYADAAGVDRRNRPDQDGERQKQDKGSAHAGSARSGSGARRLHASAGPRFDANEVSRVVDR
jgi:hypothetical protein